MLFNRKKKPKSSAIPAFSFCHGSEGALRLWVAELPRTELQLCVDRLMVCGQELLMTDWPMAQKVAALAIADEVIATTARGLERQSATAVATTEQILTQRRYNLLFGELYFQVAKDTLASKQGDESDGYLLKAMDYLAKAAISSLQVYEKTPGNCWLHLNELYLLSLTDCSNEQTVTAMGLTYKATVAVHCAQPEQLSSQQILSLYQTVQTAVAGIRIGSTVNADTHHYSIVDQDHAPERFRDDSLPKSGTVIYFDFSGLRSILENLSLQPDLKARLHKCFSPVQPRQFTRIESDERLELCHGLTNLHFLLAGRKSFDHFTRRFAQKLGESSNRFLEQHKISAAEQGKGKGDVWGTIYSNNWQAAGFSGDSIDTDIRSSSEPETVAQFVSSIMVDVINTNPGGYQISGSNHDLGQFKPGDVIGVYYPERKRWLAAVVRWSCAHFGQRDLGVELLCPNPKPRAIKLVHSKHGTEYLPALQLEDNPGSKGKTDGDAGDRILMPNVHLSAKTAALLVDEKEERRVVLGEHLESTGDYSCYQLTSADA